MKESFDVAIVGAGPAGISAACILADAGIKTIVFERGEYPGAKNVSGGVLYGHDLAQVCRTTLERGCPIERNIVEIAGLVPVRGGRLQPGLPGHHFRRREEAQRLYRGPGQVRPLVRRAGAQEGRADRARHHGC